MLDSQTKHHADAMPVFTEHVLPDLARWQAAGRRGTLITLVGINGTAPRPLGAQMAVADDGTWAGYISGGCLEQAMVHEALAAMAEGRNRLVRYGKDSPYIDIRLPCGSGLDIYVDQALSARTVADMAARLRARQPFALTTDLDTGVSTLAPPAAQSERRGAGFTRVYQPRLRLAVIGAGPLATALAMLAQGIGMEVALYSPDDAVLAGGARLGIATTGLTTPLDPPPIASDRWTAAALVFHEHEWEIAALSQLLASDCFYIGAMGSRATHAVRLKALLERGHRAEALSRIRGPAGVIPRAKSPTTIALSILAEIVAVAGEQGLSP